MSDNWARLLQQGGPNAGDAFAEAFKQDQQTRQQNMAKSAMAALVQDPNNQRALEALAQVDPQAAMQFKQQQQQQTLAGLEHHRENIIKGAQVIRQMNPRDQATWDAARAMAAQAGIDVSEVPPQYDPQYVQGIVSLADTFAPQQQHNGQMVPYVPGGGVARINPQTGQLETLVMPNEGGHQAGAPVGNLPQVTDQATYDAIPPGQQYMTPDGHTRVKQGGQTGAPSGGFF